MKKKVPDKPAKISCDPGILSDLEKTLNKAVHFALERSPLLAHLAKPSNGAVRIDSRAAEPASSTNASLAPSHGEIAIRAEALWREMGCPQGCDKQIWLAAERRMYRDLRLEKEERDRKALLDQLSLINNVKMNTVMEKLEELYPQPSSQVRTSL